MLELLRILETAQLDAYGMGWYLPLSPWRGCGEGLLQSLSKTACSLHILGEGAWEGVAPTPSCDPLWKELGYLTCPPTAIVLIWMTPSVPWSYHIPLISRSQLYFPFFFFFYFNF